MRSITMRDMFFVNSCIRGKVVGLTKNKTLSGKEEIFFVIVTKEEGKLVENINLPARYCNIEYIFNDNIADIVKAMKKNNISVEELRNIPGLKESDLKKIEEHFLA